MMRCGGRETSGWTQEERGHERDELSASAATDCLTLSCGTTDSHCSSRSRLSSFLPHPSHDVNRIACDVTGMREREREKRSSKRAGERERRFALKSVRFCRSKGVRLPLQQRRQQRLHQQQEQAREPGVPPPTRTVTYLYMHARMLESGVCVRGGLTADTFAFVSARDDRHALSLDESREREREKEVVWQTSPLLLLSLPLFPRLPLHDFCLSLSR